MNYPKDENTRGLRSVELSCMLPDLQIAARGEKVRVVVSIDGDAVYDEWLWPAPDDVVLEDLRGLVEPYAYERQTISLGIVATSEEGTTRLSTMAQVVYCEADLGDATLTAQDYLDTHFLSLLDGPKLTAPGRLELLPVQGGGGASCTAYYADGTQQSFGVGVYLSNGNFTEYDASPSQFAAAGKVLTNYVVTAGRRQQEFVIDYDSPDCAPILIFYNSFGLEEVVYCTGTLRVAPTYKRSAAYIGRYQRNYHIEETRAFKADTGPLTRAMANWLDDLFRSKYVRVANFYGGRVQPTKEVLITDSKSEVSSDDDDVPRFTFTYQYAQRNHNVMDLKRAGRIFDNTFDNTFN